MTMMTDQKDLRAIDIVKYYISLYGIDDDVEYDVFITWKAKILQNWKYMLSTNLGDDKYYEVTYNGDKRVWYLNIYEKAANVIFDDKTLNNL